MTKWYETSGTKSLMVPSSRIRLARNLRQFPFEGRMDENQKEELIRLVQSAVEKIQLGSNQFRYLRLKEMSDLEVQALFEKHLISYELMKNRPFGYVAISEDDSISIMVNEEDHIRIQVLRSGFELEQALELANRIDDVLDHELNYAFDNKLGFLTACPTNLGTGLRASVMLHLPGLHRANAIEPLANNVGKLGLTIRGSYGEGTEVEGDMFLLSNQITLGISEEAAVDNVKSVAEQILEREQKARDKMKEDIRYRDNIMRSYGILQYAELLSGSECSQLLSNLRLGVSLGLFPSVEEGQLNRLSFEYKAASLCIAAGESLDVVQRDAQRAKFIRSALQQ